MSRVVIFAIYWHDTEPSIKCSQCSRKNSLRSVNWKFKQQLNRIKCKSEMVESRAKWDTNERSESANVRRFPFFEEINWLKMRYFSLKQYIQHSRSHRLMKCWEINLKINPIGSCYSQASSKCISQNKFSLFASIYGVHCIYLHVKYHVCHMKIHTRVEI